MIPARLQWGPFWEYSQLCLSEPDFQLLERNLPGADFGLGRRTKDGGYHPGAFLARAMAAPGHIHRSGHSAWFAPLASPNSNSVSPLLGIKQLCPKTMPDSVTHPTRENAGTPFWAFLVQCPRGALMNSVRT